MGDWTDYAEATVYEPVTVSEDEVRWADQDALRAEWADALATGWYGERGVRR